LPTKFTQGVLLKDGAKVIMEPSKFEFNNKWICIVHGDYTDLVFTVSDPKHFRILKQSTAFDKTWMEYPQLHIALDAQHF
jgi:hypothetical protein